ncbi:5' nucleotidase, NT5C type [Marinigracilibium pacificum]|uniref:5'-3'-deoxyribonucleotidase n=1 Tax=Marinigracilibium pacificum TaxID=2729599 RepID=A0A848JCC5_9BACT|nr:5'-3'-deoxyribonucleotidase [Marinigracilibium pacificum]NMM50652.1 5'-3'-deoxyribonucleotidase [Marinigracilibium pacificum]
MKKRIAIDMDEVMADTLEALIDRYQNDFNIKIDRNDMTGWHLEDYVASEHKHVILDYMKQGGFFENLPLIEGAQETVERLHRDHEVFVVTAATQLPHSMEEKVRWLNKHFPYIGWKNMVMCGDKSIVIADYLIDDHAHNFDGFRGEGILFNSLHNAKETRYKRIYAWNEFEDILSASLEGSMQA